MPGIFGKALAGAGAGASQIASSYIDEQLAEQRAQVLANIQRDSAQQQDQYLNSDERRGRMSQLASADTVAAGGAADQVALNTAQNQPLTDASIMRSNAISAGTLPAEVNKAAAIEQTKPIKTNPGDIVFDGKGNVLVKNTNLTPAEANLTAYREGLKGQKGEQRDRAYESIMKSTDDQIKGLAQIIDKGISDGTLSIKPPDPKTHIFSADEPGKDPGWDRYQKLNKQLELLKGQQDDIKNQWRAELGKGGVRGPTADPSSATDPLGIFGGKPGGNVATPAPAAPTAKAGPGESDTAPIYRQQASDFLKQLDRMAPDDPARADIERQLQKTLVDAGKQGIAIDLDQLKAGATAAPPMVTPAAAAPAPAPGGIMDRVQRATDTAQNSDSGAQRRAALESIASPSIVAAARATPMPGTAAAALAKADANSVTTRAKAALNDYAEKAVKDRAQADKIREDFEKDKASMAPQAFLEKYAPLRSTLTVMQIADLMKIGRVH